MIDAPSQLSAPNSPKSKLRWLSSTLLTRLTDIRHDLLYAALAIQLISALFFIGQLWTEVLGIRHVAIPWQYQEGIQILASIGLLMGVVISGLFLRHSRQRMAQLGQQIDVASGNFESHLNEMFSQWDLSKSEQAVAVYAMKGFSNAEIADLRGTSESTIKSQMNAVYRKTDLANRQQLISFLVEEMFSGISIEAREDD